MSEGMLLEVKFATVRYTLPAARLFSRKRSFAAVKDANLLIPSGAAVGLVGETGSGKSSLSRAIYGLTPLHSGSVRFDGIDVACPTPKQRRRIRRGMQMVFQDPGGSLNPRMRVGEIVAEPLDIHQVGDRKSRRGKVEEVLDSVGLAPGSAALYPHELSGGQRQRVAIARSAILEPSLVIADEPVSALDVSLRAQILKLIAALRDELGLSLLFVSHDLGTIGFLCESVAVMYLGRIVEFGPTDKVLKSPVHPYTRDLVASSPIPDPDRPIKPLALSGEPPDPVAPPSGCSYHPRCPFATDICISDPPELRTLDGARSVECHHADKLNMREGQVRRNLE